MKGKLLSYEEITKLPHGTRVWEESKYYEGECLINQELQHISENEKDIKVCGWNFAYLSIDDYVKEDDIKIYEWIEEPQPKTYKGSEILHMIEEGILKDDDIILDKENYPWIIEKFKTEDDEECNSTYVLLEYAPFTIKQKPVNFMTAYNSHKKVKPEFGEYIYSDMKDFLEVIKNSSQDTADRLMNGKWFIKQ